MAIDVELFLTRHPFLFLRQESGIEGFHGSGVLAAISGGTGSVHPLSAVKCAGHKLTNKKCCWEVAVYHKADILLFAADKATADVVARITICRPFRDITCKALQNVIQYLHKCNKEVARICLL